jgi:hypothetical protein
MWKKAPVVRDFAYLSLVMLSFIFPSGLPKALETMESANSSRGWWEPDGKASTSSSL